MEWGPRPRAQSVSSLLGSLHFYLYIKDVEKLATEELVVDAIVNVYLALLQSEMMFPKDAKRRLPVRKSLVFL